MRLWIPKAEQDARVLAAIESGHDWGFAILRATKMSAGRVYATLDRLERDGRIAAELEVPAPAARPARRLYRVR